MRLTLITAALLAGLGSITAHSADTPPATSPSVQGAPMNIVIATPNQPPIKFALADNAVARDFYALLPLTVHLEDYAGTEKVAHDLPRKLNTAGAPRSYAGKRGDLTYYAPWGNLALFYRDHGSAAAGLIYLGRITKGAEWLEQLVGEVHIGAEMP